jgi:hypothetical protein
MAQLGKANPIFLLDPYSSPYNQKEHGVAPSVYWQSFWVLK